MIKKTTFIVLSLASLVLLYWTIPAFYEASKSIRLWNAFSKAVQEKDSATIKRLLSDSDRDLHVIEGCRILYFGKDFTEQIERKKVSFGRTLEYFLTDPQRKRFGKVVLDHGFARIEDGRITFLKFP